MALAGAAADHFGLPEPSFAEKDYWAMELLRSVMRPLLLSPSNGSERTARALFKGGTSLSKAFGIIDRFSEDVDILIEHRGLGSSARENQVLIPICDRVTADLGLAVEDAELQQHTTGTARNVHYRYPQRISSTAITPYVRLEMGIRGGTLPGTVLVPVRSYIAEYVQTEGVDADFDDLAPIDADCIAPVRTLAEKLALLHHAATAAAQGNESALARAGRHYGDIARLLGDADVQMALRTPGSTIAELAVDVDDWSAKAKWSYTPRPEDGYASSVAFSADSPAVRVARESYEDAKALMWGEVPTFAECLEVVARNASSL